MKNIEKYLLAFFCALFITISTQIHSEVLLNGIKIDDHFQRSIQLEGNGEYEKSLKVLALISTYKFLDNADKSFVELYKGYALRGLGELRKAIHAFEKSINFNPKQTNAMLHLAEIFTAGIGGIEINPEKMWYYLQTAADLNDTEAMVIMGTRYRDGKYTKQDHEKAISLFQASLDMGNASAMFMISNYYAQGLVVQQDKQYALSLLKQAYDLGDPDAAGALGNAYYFGDLVAL